MSEEKTGLNILEGFKKIANHQKVDKISITPSKIGFLAGFMTQNKLNSFNYVNIFSDLKNRRLAFLFTNEKSRTNYKLTKQRGEYFRCCILNKNIIESVNINETDFKKYDYTKHFEDGNEIYIIQLRMEALK